MAQCPTCGHDDGCDEAPVAEAIVEAAEVDAAAREATEEAFTERNADDNDTREAIAETDAEARVEIAQIEADAAVEIAEAEAGAAAAIAEAIATPEPVEEETPEEVLADELPAADIDSEELPASAPVTAVVVPPQLPDEPAGKPAARKTQTVSRFRARATARSRR